MGTHSQYASSSPYGAVGSSPGSSHFEKHMQHSNAAKGFWNRLKYDGRLNPQDFAVGYEDTCVKPQRKSGKHAWSERAHGFIVEETFPGLLSRWGDNVPYHKIRFFKENGTVVWLAEGAKSGSFVSAVAGLASLSLDSPGPAAARPLHGGEHSSGEEDSDDAAAQATVRCDLPEDCWRLVAQHLSTRDLCTLSCCCTATRHALHNLQVWRPAYEGIFGRPPWELATVDEVKMRCRVSELQAWDWFHSSVGSTEAGFAGTTCLAMDDSKVVSADGANVRVWSYRTRERFFALKASSAVRRVAMNDAHLAALEEGGLVRLWDVDDLKASRMLRTAEAGGTLVDLCFAGGMLLTANRNGEVGVFDPALRPHMITAMHHPHGLEAVLCTSGGHVVSAGSHISMWDMQSGTEIVRLFDGTSEARSTLSSISHFHLDALTPCTFQTLAAVEHLLLAATPEFLTLWDFRTADAVALYPAATHDVWQHPKSVASGSSDLVGLFADSYKLGMGFRYGITIHDLRAASSSCDHSAWPRTMHVLDDWLPRTCSSDNDLDLEDAAPLPSRLQCMACCGGHLVAGFDSSACRVWGFGKKARESCRGSEQDGEEGEKRKKKEKKMPKRQNRYPKRTSR